MQEAAEAELVATLQPFMKACLDFCSSRALLSASTATQSAALLALVHMMAASRTFCDSALQLVFTLLTKRCGPISRSDRACQ